VQELIDPTTNQWDEQLVRESFWQIDAEVILSIAIRDDFEDFMAWQFDSKGIFLVKSAYHLYVKDRRDMIPESSNAADQGLKWEKIWKLTCQPKIKQFIWRLAYNSLPVKRNIKHIGIECDTICVCCRCLDEDGAHLFLGCTEVVKVWQELGEVVQQILKLEEKDSTLVCCFLWSWWCRHNKINVRENVGAWQQVVSQARKWVVESLQFCGNRMINVTRERSLHGVLLAATFSKY
jgi:hypothetical protein